MATRTSTYNKRKRIGFGGVKAMQRLDLNAMQ